MEHSVVQPWTFAQYRSLRTVSPNDVSDRILELGFSMLCEFAAQSLGFLL